MIRPPQVNLQTKGQTSIVMREKDRRRIGVLFKMQSNTPVHI
jgi:hypothetical protein